MHFKCWESAGVGSGGVELDSIGKIVIFSPENALEATDSDLRLQPPLFASIDMRVGNTRFGSDNFTRRSVTNIAEK